MRLVNMREAKTHLSRLVHEAAQGKPFIIAKAGKPVVKVTALDTPIPTKVRRLGFLSGQFAVPEDFDRMGSAEIDQQFRGVQGNCWSMPASLLSQWFVT